MLCHSNLLVFVTITSRGQSFCNALLSYTLLSLIRPPISLINILLYSSIITKEYKEYKKNKKNKKNSIKQRIRDRTVFDCVIYKILVYHP